MHDNDFLVISDRYYTFGLFLNYTMALDKGLVNNGNEQLYFTLSQQAYTPSNIETQSITEMDRRYVGYLALETGWSTVVASSLYRANIQMGLLGPASGVGKFQQWYHDHIVKYKTPTWAHELPNALHTNLELNYAKEWEWAPNPFGVYFAVTPSAVMGSKEIFIQPEVIAFFGRKNPLPHSMAYHQIGNLERELYFSLEFAYKWVEKNVFLEKEKLEKTIFLFTFNFHHRYLTHEYRVGYHYNSKEALGLERHQYISLSYSKSF
ncbi:MAG: DUF2219 family protein [Flavobacteriaceae bacterium]